MEHIRYENNLLSIIIRSHYSDEGIKFFTPENFSQQLGYMQREKDYVIEPHVHNLVLREVFLTQEVLFIKSGKVRIDFYTDNKDYINSTIVEKGDVVLLASGGHGFKMLEKSEIFEVKQGPYCGDLDKTRFRSIDDTLVNYKINE
jgi:hypothetical protein